MVTTKGSNENDSVTSGLHEHRCNCCILVKRSSFHFRIVCHHKLIKFIQNAFEFFTKGNSARSGGSDRSGSVLSLFAFTAMKALLLCVKAKFNHLKWPLPGNFYLWLFLKNAFDICQIWLISDRFAYRKNPQFATTFNIRILANYVQSLP